MKTSIHVIAIISTALWIAVFILLTKNVALQTIALGIVGALFCLSGTYRIQRKNYASGLILLLLSLGILYFW